MIIGVGTQHAKDELREFVEAKNSSNSHYQLKQSYLMTIHTALVT